MSWSNQLEQASFGGAEFECQATDDDLARRVVETSYPYRDGADTEDLGREPRRTTVKAVFVGDEYLSQLGSLLQIIDSGKPARFVHPIMGVWRARAKRGAVHHTHDERDMASVDIELVEDGTNTEIPDLFSVQAMEAEVEEYCVEVEELNDIEEPTVTDAISAIREFVADATSLGGRLADQLNKVRRQIDQAVDSLKELTDPSSWKLVRAVKRVAYSVQKLAQRVQSLRPPLVLKRLEAAMPVSLFAHKLYGDAKRQDEILRMNRVRNTFVIPAGTELKVYSR